MSWDAADFQAPTGQLQETMYPGLDLDTLLTGWITQAETKAAVEAADSDNIHSAAGEYVYYLAYTHVADRLANTPNSVSVDAAANLSTSVGKDRIEYFTKKAADHLASYRQLVKLAQRQDYRHTKSVVTRSVF